MPEGAYRKARCLHFGLLKCPHFGEDAEGKSEGKTASNLVNKRLQENHRPQRRSWKKDVSASHTRIELPQELLVARHAPESQHPQPAAPCFPNWSSSKRT